MSRLKYSCGLFSAVFNPFELRCVEVPIISSEDCNRSYPGLITDRMVCAGYKEGGKDACQVFPHSHTEDRIRLGGLFTCKKEKKNEHDEIMH